MSRRGGTGGIERGFTLVEILVVVAILAMVARIVTANLGALIPGAVLDATAREIMGSIAYLRSEAQLQGKTYTFEFDLERNRWRIVLPPEERLVSTQSVGDVIPLQWSYLDERVKFGGFDVLGDFTARSGVARLEIDENGYTCEAMIHLRLVAEALEDYVWTIKVNALEPRSDLLTSIKGDVPRLERIEEHHF